MTLKKIITVQLLLIALTALAFVSSTSNAHAAVMRRCHTQIHYTIHSGAEGRFSSYVTCGGGNYPFRSQAECFNNNGNGGHAYRYGAWEHDNDKWSIAQCKAGTYIDVGGYEVGGSGTFHVLWRKGGTPA